MREPIVVWVCVILGLGFAQLLSGAVPVLSQLVGALAVAAFLYVPARMLERRGQEPRDAGWRFDRLGADLAWALGSCALILPLFALAFFALPHLPPLRALLAPYGGAPRWHRIPFTFDLLGQIAGNGAVACSEEFFYRGYLTLRFEERTTPVRAALLAAALFALGHLLRPAPFRLAVFFPALWFAFLRNRTRTVAGASVAHWLANVTLLLLERAAY